MSLRVVRSGALTTVQDLGRPGFARWGIPPSGAMDALALRAANLLVGNDGSAAGLEFTLSGPSITFEQDGVAALTGSAFEASLEGRAVPPACAFTVAEGETLAIGRALEGARGYLAVRGGIAVRGVLGSRSTHVVASLGPAPLEAGDVLPLGSDRPHPPLRALKPGSLPEYTASPTLRAVPGPQDEAFSEAARATFHGSIFTVSARSDRTGLRLDGPLVEHVEAADVLPEGVPAGAVQVPGDGHPIVLGVDRPVTGGYAKIATVIAADFGLLAHAKPGDTLRFAQTTVEEARAAWRERERALLDGIEEIGR